jgi:hypothetical protein
MARCRKLSTDISLDLAVNRLDDFTALLYTWLVPHAEDDCSLPKEPEVIAAKVMPLRRIDPAKIQASVNALLEAELLIISADGRLRIEPTAFYRYQTYVNASKRFSAENSKEQQETAENSTSLSLSVSPSPSPSLSTKGEFPECLRVKVEKGGKEKELGNHLLCDLEQFCGTWAVSHRKDIAEAIKAGCPECDGSCNTKCATAFFNHAKELSGQGPPFPTGLFLWRLTNGAR